MTRGKEKKKLRSSNTTWGIGQVGRLSGYGYIHIGVSGRSESGPARAAGIAFYYN